MKKYKTQLPECLKKGGVSFEMKRALFHTQTNIYKSLWRMPSTRVTGWRAPPTSASRTPLGMDDVSHVVLRV
jgi:hypothetical protein